MTTADVPPEILPRLEIIKDQIAIRWNVARAESSDPVLSSPQALTDMDLQVLPDIEGLTHTEIARYLLVEELTKRGARPETIALVKGALLRDLPPRPHIDQAGDLTVLGL